MATRGYELNGWAFRARQRGGSGSTLLIGPSFVLNNEYQSSEVIFDEWFFGAADMTLAAAGTASATQSAALTTEITPAADGTASATVATASLTTAITLAAAGTASATVASAEFSTSVTLAAAGTASATAAAPLTTEIALATTAGAFTDGAAALAGADSEAVTVRDILSATGTASATGAAALQTSITLAAAPTGVGTGAAALTTAITAAAAGTGVGTGAAALTTAIMLAAAPTGVGTGAGALTTAITAAATGTASGTGAAALQTAIQFAAAGTAAGTGAAALLAGSSTLDGVGTAVGTGAAALTTAITMAAAPTGVGTGAAALTTAITLAAAPTGTATGVANLLVSSTLAATPTASATGVAALTTTITLAAGGYAYGAGDATFAEIDGEGVTVYANFGAAATGVGTGVADLYLPGDTSLAGVGTASATGAAAVTTSIRLAAAPTAVGTGAAALTTAITLAASGTGTATPVAILFSPSELAAVGTARATGAAALTTALPLAADGTASATSVSALTTVIQLAAAGTAVAGENPDPEWGNTVLLLHDGAMTTDATQRHALTLSGDYYEAPASADWVPGVEYTWEGGWTFTAPLHDAVGTALVGQAGAFAISVVGPDSSTRNGMQFTWYEGGTPFSITANGLTLVPGLRYMWGVALVDDIVELFINGARVGTDAIGTIDPSSAVLRVHTLTDEVRLTRAVRFLGGYSPETGRLPDDNAYATISTPQATLEAAATASATGAAALTTAITARVEGTASATAAAPLTTQIALAAAGTASATGTSTVVIRHDLYAAGTATATPAAPLQTSILLGGEGVATACAGATGTVTLRNVNNVDTTAPTPPERVLTVPFRQRHLYVIPDDTSRRVPVPLPQLDYDRPEAATGVIEASGTGTAIAAAALATFITFASMGVAAATATASLLVPNDTTLAAAGTAVCTGAGFIPLSGSLLVGGGTASAIGDVALSVGTPIAADAAVSAVGAADLSVSGWTPALLSSSPAQLWVNDDSTYTDNGSSSTWDDLIVSGVGDPEFQASSTARPTTSTLNGRRVLVFDGSNDGMNINFDYTRAIYRNTGVGWALIVTKKTALDGSATNRTVLDWPTPTSATSRFRLDLGSTVAANKPRMLVRRLDADSAGILSASAVTDTAWHMWLVQMDWDTGTGYLYLDGALDASSAGVTSSGVTSDTQSAVGPSIGRHTSAVNPCDASIAEIVMGADTLLSSGDIDRLFGYAAHRWALTANLPSGHPYKTSPP